MSVVINIVLILASILLIVVVLMQEGNKQGLGVIGGAAETFLGKNKAKSYEGKLLMSTRILAAIFVVLAIVATWLNARSYTVTYKVADEASETGYTEYFPYAASYADSYNYMIDLGMQEGSKVDYATIVASSEEAALRNYTTYKKGDDITVYAVPAKEGYTGKWLTKDGKELPATMGRTNYEVFANYEIGTYTVTVTDKGVNGDNAEPTLYTVTAEYGTAIEYPETVKLPEATEGYLVTWSAALPATIPGADTEVSVTYTAGNYISYFNENGEEIFPYAEDYASYYAYAEWYQGMVNGDEAASTMDIAAKTEENYKALYEHAVEEGNLDAMRQFVATGDAITAYDAPAKEGYVGAWDVTLPETMDGQRYELHAVYTIGSYTVNVVDNGIDDANVTTETVTEEVTGENGEVTTKETEVKKDNVIFTAAGEFGTAIEYTEAVKLPEAPEGYTVEWSAELPQTIPGADTTVKVTYKAIVAEATETAAEAAETTAEATETATEAAAN